jgi:nitroimidazol reductase NimA-like FMN-containing flavoprotein (pyridoxamine 5'-phosphate oxidase superfamily)
MTETRRENGLEELSAAECFQLLGSQPIGRLVFHEGGLPAIRLVNFVLDGGAVVFRTGGGQMFAAAARGDVVAFEVDEYDADRHLGWTVTAVGHLSPITDPVELDRISRLPVRPWAPGERPNALRVDVESISGRRLLPWGQRSSGREQSR